MCRVVDQGHFFNRSVGQSVCAPQNDGSVGPFGPMYVYSVLGGIPAQPWVSTAVSHT
jgi:hypothetical protein